LGAIESDSTAPCLSLPHRRRSLPCPFGLGFAGAHHHLRLHIQTRPLLALGITNRQISFDPKIWFPFLQSTFFSSALGKSFYYYASMNIHSANRLVAVWVATLTLTIGQAAWCQPLLLRDHQQVILLGDSLTEGEDPDGYVNTTRLILANVLPKLTLFTANAGKGGNTSADLEDRLQRDVLQFKPDWVTICIGVNDINQRFGYQSTWTGPKGVELPAFKEKVTNLVRRIQSQGGQVLLCSGTIIKEDLAGPENGQMELYSEALRQVAAEQHCLLADTRRAFSDMLTPLQKPGLPSSGVLTVDGVHLRPQGSWLLAKTIVAAWGVPPDDIERVRPAVDEQIRKQTDELNRRLARYRQSNYEVGLFCAG
jgi:lysophospholipase L1-like esterase